MTRLVTFTDARMTISAQKLKESAYKNGVDDVIIYEKNGLTLTFNQMAKPTIDISKGAGLYIWKPFIIWDYMQGLSDGDHLIYADAGQTFVSSVRPVIDGMDQDIMMFSNGWPMNEWTKMDLIADVLYEEYMRPKPLDGRPQVQASLIFFKVTKESRDFVKRWMLWCLMPGVCDDSPSDKPNLSTFAETRWDQSVLGVLQVRYGYRLHWFPTLTAYHIKAEYPNDKYPAIVDHHRRRNEDW